VEYKAVGQLVAGRMAAWQSVDCKVDGLWVVCMGDELSMGP
jgi:hypothetical protein